MPSIVKDPLFKRPLLVPKSKVRRKSVGTKKG